MLRKIWFFWQRGKVFNTPGDGGEHLQGQPAKQMVGREPRQQVYVSTRHCTATLALYNIVLRKQPPPSHHAGPLWGRPRHRDADRGRCRCEMDWNLPPPGDIPSPPASSAHKYRIDVKERVVRADFSSSSSARLGCVFCACGDVAGSAIDLTWTRF